MNRVYYVLGQRGLLRQPYAYLNGAVKLRDWYKACVNGTHFELVIIDASAVAGTETCPKKWTIYRGCTPGPGKCTNPYCVRR